MDINVTCTISDLLLVQYIQENAIGRRNKVTARKLRGFGYGDGREIRKAVHRLRLLGYPICSNTQGYWWAEDLDELKETINFLDGMITNMTEVSKALKQVLNGADKGGCGNEEYL